jgi:hypothetical protein
MMQRPINDINQAISLYTISSFGDLYDYVGRDRSKHNQEISCKMYDHPFIQAYKLSCISSTCKAKSAILDSK